MATGHHAAVSADVAPGDTVVVVGDGAVGLSAVLASHRLGAERVIALSRHPERPTIARRFGATDIIPTRGAEADVAMLVLTAGIGVDAALDFETDLDGTPEAYAAMDERRAVKSLIRVGSL